MMTMDIIFKCERINKTSLQLARHSFFDMGRFDQV